MPVWKVCIRPDPEAPDLAQGYVLAADREDAFATVDHPDAEVFEAGPERQHTSPIVSLDSRIGGVTHSIGPPPDPPR